MPSSPRLTILVFLIAAGVLFTPLTAHACTAPSTGGVTVCSPATSSNTVNPIHVIAAASTTTCSSGVSSISILNASTGGKLYTIGGSQLDTFLPIKPGSYTLTVRETDKCGGTQQTNVAVTARGTAVITYQYNVERMGANTYETSLTPSNVNASTFGKIFSCSVDSYIYGQPLYMPGLTIGGVKHNVVFVATENNSIYAFDADGKSCTPLWHDFVDTPVPCNVDSPEPGSNCNLVLGTPGVGITSTMFIDPTQGSQGVIYAEARTAPSGVTGFFHGLHKYDVATGIEMSDSPAVVGATIAGNSCDNVNGVVTFDNAAENNRSALLYANGVIYIAFGSINDVPVCPGPTYHGWILGYNAFNIKQQLVVFDDTRNASTNGSGPGQFGAIWGGAMAASVTNWVFAVTGNGSFDPSVGDWSNAYLKFKRGTGTTLQVADYFAPHFIFNNDDKDLGTNTGIIIDHAAPNPHELIGGDKLGTLYVVNRDNMGKFNTTDQVIQELPNAVGVRTTTTSPCDTLGDDDCDYSSPTYWNGKLYVAGINDHVKAFTLSSGLLSGPTSHAPQTFGYPGATTSVSANGTSNGIVWAVEPAKAVLHAYSAANLATELYNSNQNSTRDALGSNVKFAPVTIVNGHVYVGTKDHLVGYGLLSGGGTTSLTVTVTTPTNGQTVSNPVSVKASASGPNPISQMQVWVNFKEVFSISGTTINTTLTLPVGTDRFVVQAVDSTGATAKVVESITVN